MFNPKRDSRRDWILMVLVVALVACGAPEPTAQPVAPANTLVPSTDTPYPPTETPEPPSEKPNNQVVLDMVERLNAGDVEGSMAYFADDVIGYITGLPPTGMEVYAGKEALRALWEDSASNHFQWEVEIARASLNEVQVYAKTWHDFTRELGVAPLEWFDVYELKDGKITTYSSTLTQDALARLKPALAEAMPPEPAAEPPAGVPRSEMTITFAGGTCTADGPLSLQAGELALTLDVQDQNGNLYLLMLFNLDEDRDLPDLMAATLGMPPSWSDTLLDVELAPGERETHTFTLEKGPVYAICFSEPPGRPIGNAGPIEVVPQSAPTATVSPTEEPEILATSAEEIVGEYSIPESSFSAGEGQLWLFLRDDGTGGVGYYSATGAQRPADFSGTWTLEAGLLKFAYAGSCDIDYQKTEKDGVVGSYEVRYRQLGGDRPAELTFAKVEDECFFNSRILTQQPWKRYEP